MDIQIIVFFVIDHHEPHWIECLWNVLQLLLAAQAAVSSLRRFFGTAIATRLWEGQPLPPWGEHKSTSPHKPQGQAQGLRGPGGQIQGADSRLDREGTQGEWGGCKVGCKGVQGGANLRPASEPQPQPATSQPGIATAARGSLRHGGPQGGQGWKDPKGAGGGRARRSPPAGTAPGGEHKGHKPRRKV